MQFLIDLWHWFFQGNEHKNKLPIQSVSIDVPTQHEIEKILPPKPEPAAKESPTFDFLKDDASHQFLADLQSLRPLAVQFDKAREDLIRELQRLAPPKKSIFEIFRKSA